MRLLPFKRNSRALTLVETLIAIGVFGIAVTGVIISLLQMNRFAVSGRNQSNAKDLCQEIIEQVLTVPYSATGTVPDILKEGQASEDVAVYTDLDNTTVRVMGKRTTKVETADASLNLLRITVTVSYPNKYHKDKMSSYEMYTMRAPD